MPDAAHTQNADAHETAVKAHRTTAQHLAKGDHA